MSEYTYKEYADTRIYTPAMAYSPDGKQLAHVTNESGQFNLWVMDSGGGNKRQLTHYTDNTVRGVDWSPDGKTIVFSADHDGDEQHQLYLLDVASGTITPLRPTEGRQHILKGFSPDGQWVAYAANDVEPQNMDSQVVHVATGEHRRLNTGMFSIVQDWSKDSRYVAILELRGNTDSAVWRYDLHTGELDKVVESETEEGAQHYSAGFSPDGGKLYFVTDEGREFVGLGVYDFAAKRRDWLFTPDGDVEQVIITKTDILVCAVNTGGTNTLSARHLITGEAVAMPDLPLGVLTGMIDRPDGAKLALTFAKPTAAGNLYEFDLHTGEMVQLGQSMLAGIPDESFVTPILVHYPTFDGKQIPAWLYRPRGEGKFPVVLSIHGGPEAQERPTYNYNGFYQYLLSRGIGVLAPNIRGSTGYGKSYQKLIHRDWGGDELKDIEHAAKYLQAQEWVDSARMAVFGGSFGGFATLSAATRLPEYWAAAVDIVGPSNLVTFAKAVPPHWKRMMAKWVGDPETEVDFLMQRSPITYVNQLRAPLLVIQGANDPRVVKAESDQMVEKIQANGGDVLYYVDEAEGHGTTRKETTLRWYTMIGDFLLEKLG